MTSEQERYDRLDREWLEYWHRVGEASAMLEKTRAAYVLEDV